MGILSFERKVFYMTKLTCSVYNFAHNKYACCCKPNIKVGGQHACSCDETCCDSYSPKGNENVVACTTPNEKLEIACSAEECVYNKEHKCQANNVSINKMGMGISCSTFTKRI